MPSVFLDYTVREMLYLTSALCPMLTRLIRSNLAVRTGLIMLIMKERMEYMARHHDSLLKTMTDEQKEIFEKFDDCWSEYISLAEKAIFEYAFKLGGRLMLEMLS